MNNLEIITPGEILKTEFMEPFGLSSNALGLAIGVPANRITDILKARRSITPDTALRLGQYFDMPPEFWLNLQMHYELRLAREALGRQVPLSRLITSV
ncbi:MAG: HigA family addiction module antitoxin [Myxococcaceae bacterium]